MVDGLAINPWILEHQLTVSHLELSYDIRNTFKDCQIDGLPLITRLKALSLTS